jgi:hypothetical protein
VLPLDHPLAFLPFEVLMVGLLFLCFRHALPFGAPAMFKLASGVVFGILLEWATIEQLDAYQYGTQYLLMVDTVPIAVGVGWGVILYSAMLLTDNTNLNPWLRPVADALLALNIDVAIDAIAIRAGMWDWGKGLEHDYFGVPYENFWAWFWVIFCFSLSYRICYRLTIKYHVAIAPIVAIPLSVCGVLITNRIIVSYIPETHTLAVIIGVLLTALAVVFYNKPQLRSPNIDPLAAWVPLCFHAAFLLLGMLTGVIFEHQILMLISLVMIGISLYLHRHALFKD